jgi:hypothetical protein
MIRHGRLVMYRRLRGGRFTVDGQRTTLTLVADKAGALFLSSPTSRLISRSTVPAATSTWKPFNDEQVLVDFNLAYTPSCTNDNDWSCPITLPHCLCWQSQFARRSSSKALYFAVSLPFRHGFP